MVRVRLLWILVIAVVPCDAAFATSAFIGTDPERGTQMLQVLADAGEENDVTVVEESASMSLPAQAHVSDSRGITAGPGCRQVSATSVQCGMGGDVIARLDLGDLADRAVLRNDEFGHSWRVEAGDGADRFEAVGRIFMARGGAGDDVLIGPANRGLNGLRGDDGDDHLVARGGYTDLVGGAGNDRLEAAGPGEFKTILDGGPGADVFLGGAGSTAVVTYADRTAPVTADIDGEADDGEAGEADLVGAEIDALIGGSSDDTLMGNEAPNELRGSGGNDLLDGSGGADTVYGGVGDDLLRGREGDDWLTGDEGADELDGGEGSDRLDFGYELRGPGGWSGADVFSGGGGMDSVTYGAAYEAVSVDLEGDADDGPAGKGDTVLPDVERLVGTAYDDRLTGSPGNDRLVPGTGRDVVSGAPGDDIVEVARGPFSPGRVGGGYPFPDSGPDLIDGGTGIDTIDYSGAGPARVDLSNGAGTGGSSTQPQRLVGVENLIGSRYADGFIGGPEPNVFLSGDGHDSIVSRPGEGDVVDCGPGDDTLELDAVASSMRCEFLDRAGVGPRVQVRRRPVRVYGSYATLRLTFSESWVAARVRLHHARSGRAVSGWYDVPASDKREKLFGVRLTRSGMRRLRRRDFDSRIVFKMRDLAGHTRTAKVRRRLLGY